jgi:hypothetical protein
MRTHTGETTDSAAEERETASIQLLRVKGDRVELRNIRSER